MAAYIIKRSKVVLAVNGELQQFNEGDEINLSENVAKGLLAKGRIAAKAEKATKTVGQKSK